MIRIEGITHRFGAFQVLSDVWFHVPKGEIFGFIGPNGAGKTTTIRMMATLLEPDDGRILIDGLDVVERPAEVRKIVGFMPDGFGVYERITVSEYLEFFAAAHALPIDRRAKTVRAVMDLTELGQIQDKLVNALSKGMKQRLAIARTLLHDPEVLVLDEPANGLDPRARIEMRQLIEELQRLGKTIVLSSHILTELSDMVTSVVILERGKVLATGAVGEIGRKLRPDRALRIRLLGKQEGLEAVFSAVPGVVSVAREEAASVARGQVELRLQYAGGDEVIAMVVQRAVQAGLAVIRVEPDQNDLERIFLEVTKGELQ